MIKGIHGGTQPRTIVAGFLLLTVGVLVGIALVVGSMIGAGIRDQALHGAEQSARVFLDIGMERDDFGGGRLRPQSYWELAANVRDSRAVLGARLWDVRRGLAHEFGPQQPGAPAVLSPPARAAFRHGARTELVQRSDEGEDTEVRAYLPLPSGREGAPTRQVLELRLAGEQIAREISVRRRRVYAILLAATLLLCVVLLPTVIKGARALAERHRSTHLGLQRELRRALRDDELLLHYQPKLELRSGKVIGVEALLRWQHPRRGLLPPSEFLPAAEETSLALPITIRVLELAFARLADWRREGSELPVAVNVSPAVLTEPELPRVIERLLREHGLRAQDVTLEITESAIDQASLLPALAHLKSLGLEVSIDDFGTGHSSLARLDTLPIDELKLDRSFIGRLAAGRGSTLVAMVIELAHELGLSVVAEGVETQAIADALAALGCDTIQGHYVSRPLPPEELEGAVAAGAPVGMPA